MNEMLQDMATDVDNFQTKILNITPSRTGMLTNERLQQRLDHIREELGEILQAQIENKPHEVVDGFIDIVYLALGSVLEMGVPPKFAWDEVHRANMNKKQGKSARNGMHEAIKPEGWHPPDHGPLLEKVKILNEVSPLYIELTKLRLHKGNNYNRGSVKREDHFPFGHFSFAQMLAVKYQRINSLVQSLMEPSKWPDVAETNRLIRRELNDIIVYAGFYAEWMDGGRELEK